MPCLPFLVPLYSSGMRNKKMWGVEWSQERTSHSLFRLPSSRWARDSDSNQDLATLTSSLRAPGRDRCHDGNTYSIQEKMPKSSRENSGGNFRKCVMEWIKERNSKRQRSLNPHNMQNTLTIVSHFMVTMILWSLGITRLGHIVQSSSLPRFQASAGVGTESIWELYCFFSCHVHEEFYLWLESPPTPSLHTIQKFSAQFLQSISTCQLCQWWVPRWSIETEFCFQRREVWEKRPGRRGILEVYQEL